MFEAQRLFKDDSVFSPWFPRGGDILIATVDVIDIPASGGTLTVKVFTKTADDPGDGDDAAGVAGTEISRTSAEGAGQEDQEWVAESLTPGLEDLVRYKFTFTASAATDSVLFRMLAPVWFDAVSA